MKALLFFSFVFLSIGYAKDFKYLARSPEGLLMGDAYTTLATGPFSLFYNPALSASEKLFSFYPFPVSAGAIDYFAYEDEIDSTLDAPNAAAIARTFTGTPIHLHTGFFPTVKLLNFTFTPFITGAMDSVILDQVHPVLDMDYRMDRGFATGIAYPFKSGNRTFSVGVGAKYIKRSAIVGQFDLFGKTTADILNQSSLEFDDVRDALGESVGNGWGGDIGVDYRYKKGPGTFAMGLSVLDIGGTRIARNEGNGKVPDQDMSVNFGTSFEFDTLLLNWAVSADVHPINADIEPIQKVHFGARVGIPMITGMIGYNGGYLSYGATARIFPFRISAGFYGKEVGEVDQKLESERLVLYVSLLDFTIDMP